MPSNITTEAPEGAHFEFEEVKTARGTESLGEVPLLVWDDLDKARAFYTDEGILAVLDGTSLRVSFQGTARRLKAANKADDDIAKAQSEFRPGRRQGGQSTPTSRATRAAKSASEKVNGDAISELLEKIASGQISAETLAAMGITSPLAPPVQEPATAGVGAE